MEIELKCDCNSDAFIFDIKFKTDCIEVTGKCKSCNSYVERKYQVQNLENSPR